MLKMKAIVTGERSVWGAAKSLLLAGMFMLLFACLAPQTLHAQFNASLSGTVQDSSGAVVPGATVSLTNLSTHEQKSTTTGQGGFYRFSELAPGQYMVEVSASGFEGQTYPNVGISAEVPRGLDVKLTIGKANQTVNVSADQLPVLQTNDAAISSTIGAEDVTKLPIFGRDPYELLKTGVGIVGDGARSGSGGAVTLPNNTSQNQSNYGIFQTENQIQISASGQRVTSNTYAIDGVTVDSLLHGGSAIITPNPESVSQITIVAANYDASLGRNVGAHIQTVSNAGSNKYHGSLFFQYDEPGLNAYQSYGGPTANPGQFAPPIRNDNAQREWAGSIGGPIVKDKLFWFASYEAGKSSQQSFSETYVPTPQFYAGLAAAQPNGLVAGTITAPGGQAHVKAILPGLCSVIQTICNPVGNGFDIGSFAGAPGQYLPNVNVNGTPANPNLYTGGGLDGIPDLEFAQIQTPSNYRGTQFNGRVDWYITPKDQFAASFYSQKLDQTSLDASSGAATDTALPFRPFNSSATVLYIHTFSPSLVNELRGNYTRFSDNQITDTAGQVDWGVPGMYVQNYGFGQIDLSIRSGPDTPAIFAENTYEVRDQVSKLFGGHSLRMGVVLRREQDNDNLSGLARPNYAFQGIWDAANDAPLYEGIAADPNTGGVGNAQRYFRDNYYAGFVQDDWKAKPNLTINVGVRYEYFGELYNKGMKINNIQLASVPGQQLINATLQPTSHLYPSTPDAIAPKVGFAWQPLRDNGKLVIHGGFGVSFDQFDHAPISPAYENGPGYFNYGLCCGGLQSTNPNADGTGIVFEYGTSDSPFSYAPNPNLATGVNPITNTPNQFNGGATPYTPQVETYSVLPHMKQPTLYNFSFDGQYELPYQMALTVGYQGASGFHFLRLVDQNFLYDQSNGTCANGGACTPGVNQTPFYAAYVPTADVHTSYNAMNVHLEKRLQHGFTFSGVYTWSKSMDYGSQEGPGYESNQTNPAFPKTEYGPSDFDVRNRVSMVGVWSIPSPAGNGWKKQVLGNWQANGVYTWHTGFPWTPVIGVPTVALTNGASTLAPTRPTYYTGQASNDCSNGSFIHGSNFSQGSTSYFGYYSPVIQPGTHPGLGTQGVPGIGRNSFNGPCYQDTDVSLAKQITVNPFGHASLIRFQANFFNIFNTTNLSPLSFGSTATTISYSTGANNNPLGPKQDLGTPNPLFGIAPSSDSGRVIEFLARIQF